MPSVRVMLHEFCFSQDCKTQLICVRTHGTTEKPQHGLASAVKSGRRRCTSARGSPDNDLWRPVNKLFVTSSKNASSSDARSP